MRTAPRLASTLVATALALLAAAPASASLPDRSAGTRGGASGDQSPGDEVVGGARLASPDVVVGAGAPPVPDVAAASWIVADADTGEVLAARDAHGRYAPASTIKTLTALTLIPELPADRVVTASWDDVAVDGSRVGLVEETDYPVHELFSALLMVSGNDAANVLASAAGGQERTAELMNAKAAAIGALDTHAVNPHGLDAEGQVSSAYDLALIARAGLADEDFTRYASTLSSSVAAPDGERIAMHNKNRLLTDYPGALAGKNGYTSTARASFVGAAERGDQRLVVALMKSVPQVFDEAVTLLDWGFSARGATPVGTLVAVEPEPEPVDVLSGTTDGSAATAGPGTAATAAPGTSSADSAGLPVTLAGVGLAAAALLAVRPRPAPARPARARRSPPARTASRPPSRPAAGRRDPVRQPVRR